DDRLRFTILHTNDEHSHLIPHPAIDDHPDRINSAIGGFARLAGAIHEIRNQKESIGEPVLLLSGGDILGGPVFGWLPLMEGVAAEISLFHLLGYDAVTIGNHEFDYGADVFAGYLKTAGYPDANEKTIILGSNTRPPAEHPLSEVGIQNRFIKELPNGLKLGVFGLIGYDAINKTAFPGPVEFDDPIETAKKMVEELIHEGADILISVNHSGVKEDRLLAEAVPEIDVIVGGHSHTPLYEPIIVGKTVIVQAGSYLSYLGQLELEWLTQEKRVSVLNHESATPFLKLLDSTVIPNEVVAEEVERIEWLLNDWIAVLTDQTIIDIRQPVAGSKFTIEGGRFQRETPMGNYITDAMRYSAERVTGKNVDIAVQASGAIRSNIKPGVEEWSEGKISFYDLIMSTGLGSGDDGLPGYPMVSFYLTESEVHKALEGSVLLSELRDNAYFLQFSGLSAAYDPDRAVLLKIPFSDKPIPTYRSVLSVSLDEGDDTFRSISSNSDELIHVVTDKYVAGFLPQIGEILPQLIIQLKDESGHPIELDDTVIMENDRQLKVWQAVLDYTLSHQVRMLDLPEIPERYETTENRLRQVPTLPLWVWPLIILVLITATAFWLFRKK
ncbi:MAG: bifunctional metallophosphatase/5'-nucleotidase, partial [Balneolaceae bacterium]